MRREWKLPRIRCSGVVAAALAWLAATVLVHRMPGPMGLLQALALLAALAGAWRYARWRWLPWFAAGMIWTAGHIHLRLSDWLPIELQGEDFAVSGWVDGFPGESAGQVSFPFRVEAGEPEGTVPERLRLTWYEPPPDLIGPGSALDLVVRLKRPRGLMNPGGFDYARWLFQEGYGATGYVRDGRSAAHESGGIPREWLMFRARLGESIRAAAATPDAAALQVALSIGERFGFEDSHWRTLQRTGTSHLVAISGLHSTSIPLEPSPARPNYRRT